MNRFMKTLSIVSVAGLASMTLAMSAQARTVTKPMVTGIGFANTEAGATGQAIRAWTKTAKQTYGRGFGNYNEARGKSLKCDFIGGGNSYAKGRRAIGVEGDVNGRWSCTAKARPVGRVAGGGGGDDATAMIKGVGFGNNKGGARSKAIGAWREVVRNRYGRSFDKFMLAGNKSVNCERIGFSARNARGVYNKSVGVDGNPNAPWTCTAKGRPRNLIGRLF